MLFRSKSSDSKSESGIAAQINWAYYNIVSATNTFSFGKMTPLENKKEDKKDGDKAEPKPIKTENNKKDL